MSIPMFTTVTLSCNGYEQESGPTIVHSTGVPGYRILPCLIQVLQEAFGNSRLCDDEQGVRCVDPPASVIEAFQYQGFEVTDESEANDRAVWVLTKTN